MRSTLIHPFLTIIVRFSLRALLMFVLLSSQVNSQDNQHASRKIIALSPHLTEIVYALNMQDKLVAVSEYSDYPPAALELPTIANYQGVNIAEVLRLKPTHILAWKGGNKQQDIARLKQLGFKVHESAPSTIFDLADDIRQISKFLGAARGNELTNDIDRRVAELNTVSKQLTPINVAYLMGLQPLSGSGKDPWINSLLGLCGFNNLYHDGLSSYLQLNIADLIRQSPQALIAGMKAEKDTIQAHFAPHTSVFSPKVLSVNPDTFHRFTPRVVDELEQLCNDRKQEFP